MTILEKPEAAAEPAPEGYAATPTAAVAALRGTFERGVTRPISWRRHQLESMRRMLEERESEFLKAVSADLGKPAIEGWMAELKFTINEIGHILKHLDGWAKPERVGVKAMLQPAKATIVPEPLGTVLVIAPWNYPIQLLLIPMAYAIAAGNAVVGKPSEISGATSAAIAKWVPEYLDADAVAILEGDAKLAQELLAERWDHIFYTGNGRIGRVVLQAAVTHLTPVTLELGGKSPVIVSDEANIDVAAKRIAWGKFANAGQTCVAPDYVLVDRKVERSFVDSLARAVRSFYGDDPQTSSDYGRIVNESHWDRLKALIDNKGDAQVVVGGAGDRPSRYLAPTVMTGVGWDDPVMSDEIFGPILPVIAVDGVDEAIDQVNAHDKPLALYVFSENQAVVDKVVSRTSSGGVGVNLTVLHLAEPKLPFGGVGESGMGAYHGKAGFDTFSHRKSVMQRPTRLDPPVTYPPYTSLKQRILRKVF